MKNKSKVAIAVITVFSLISAALFLTAVPLEHREKAEKKNNLNGLHRLLGDWESTSGTYSYYENWKPAGDSILEGKAKMVNKAGKIILRELLKIEKIGTHIVYIAAVNNNQPVLFTLIKTTVKDQKIQWVFENKEHDFPQRIIYLLESDNSLFARVEGLRDGKEVKEEFRLTKKGDLK